ncbi:MAG: hypothetical protein RLZZ273_1786 [Bacteroidota bacterium]|jgi:pantoate--beta-alanine ligase
MPPTPSDVVICTTIDEMHNQVAFARSSGHTIGCVPTMGYLHEGHASLIQTAAQHHGLVVVSIFVNPTQFGPSEDFERYPRDLERDLAVLRQAGATHLFLPSVTEMYPDGVRSTIHIDGITDILEGASRPTHFDGVATVVARLFQAMLPDEAYFGQKDLQQTLVIQRLVQTHTDAAVSNTRITILPTIREHDGLAKSSRNVYLNEEDRRNATVIYQALTYAQNSIVRGERSRSVIEQQMLHILTSVDALRVDYAVAVDASTLRGATDLISERTALCIAVKLGTTRLIDNMLVELPTA